MDKFTKAEELQPGPDGKPVCSEKSRRLVITFFLIDVSGSMKKGGKIEEVNKAFAEAVLKLRQIQMEDEGQFDLKVAVMIFGRKAKWIVPPTNVMEYELKGFEAEEEPDEPCFSEAFRRLGEKLSRNEYMAHQGKIAGPHIVLVTGGEGLQKSEICDNGRGNALDELLVNGWFKVSERTIVLAEEEAAKKSIIRQSISGFVNGEENILDLQEMTDPIISRLYPRNHPAHPIPISPVREERAWKDEQADGLFEAGSLGSDWGSLFSEDDAFL